MIFIANDHGGVGLKNAIVKMLEARGEKVTDLGTGTEDSVDYPDYAFACAERVAATEGALGIVVCKSGVGVSICANKVNGVRCALCTTQTNARLCRNHNDANMLALGAGNTDERTALAIVDAFLTAEFEGGRHCRRVDKIKAYEAAHVK